MSCLILQISIMHAGAFRIRKRKTISAYEMRIYKFLDSVNFFFLHSLLRTMLPKRGTTPLRMVVGLLLVLETTPRPSHVPPFRPKFVIQHLMFPRGVDGQHLEQTELGSL
jgi:hypothetical protein